MKKSFWFYLAIVAAFLFFATTMLFSEDKIPSFTAEQKAQVFSLQKQLLQQQVQLQQIQQRYQQYMQQDQGYVDVSTKMAELNKKLNAAIQEDMKGIDQTKWQLNYDTLEITPITKSADAPGHATMGITGKNPPASK
jgi:hypothetical protein